MNLEFYELIVLGFAAPPTEEPIIEHVSGDRVDGFVRLENCQIAARLSAGFASIFPSDRLLAGLDDDEGPSGDVSSAEKWWRYCGCLRCCCFVHRCGFDC